MEEVKLQESWNKKKIFIAVFLVTLLAVGGYLLKTHVLGDNNVGLSPSVKGTNAENLNLQSTPPANVNLPQLVKDNINKLKQEVSGLNIVEVASSSPQVQKIINDIKALEQIPSNQIKDICKKVCGL